MFGFFVQLIHRPTRITNQLKKTIAKLETSYQLLSWLIHFRLNRFSILFSERTLELELNLVSLNRQCMAWSGITTRKLGLVEPSGSVDISLEAVPHDTGLQVWSINIILYSCSRKYSGVQSYITYAWIYRIPCRSRASPASGSLTASSKGLTSLTINAQSSSVTTRSSLMRFLCENQFH